jgi:hypothetical protein
MVGANNNPYSSDGIGVSYYVVPTASMDFTQPAEFTVQLPATTTAPTITMYDTGSVELTAMPGTDADGNTITYYQYQQANMDVIILPIGDGRFSASVTDHGFQYPSVDLATPVEVTLTLGGHTFTSNVTPHVVENPPTNPAK